LQVGRNAPFWWMAWQLPWCYHVLRGSKNMTDCRRHLIELRGQIRLAQRAALIEEMPEQQHGAELSAFGNEVTNGQTTPVKHEVTWVTRWR